MTNETHTGRAIRARDRAAHAVGNTKQERDLVARQGFSRARMRWCGVSQEDTKGEEHFRRANSKCQGPGARLGQRA